MSSIFTRVCLAALSAALAILGSNGTPAAAQTLTPVTLRVDVFFYGSHVPLLYGIVSGIYRKHGLDVTAQTGRGSATTIQTVAAGTDQFGFADGGTLVKFAAQGLQAKQIVGILETSPAIILSMPELWNKKSQGSTRSQGRVRQRFCPRTALPGAFKSGGC